MNASGSPVRSEIQGDFFVITVDYPPVNALSHAVRQGLSDALEEAASSGTGTVILRCAGRTFFSGADISEFGKPPQTPTLPEVIQALEICPLPVIACIHGQALGGGLETALACDYRIMDAKARIGLPEVNLGLIPGAGGTQRVPRLAGLDMAFQLAVTGKPIGAGDAKAAGLADAVAQGDLLDAAKTLAGRGPISKRIVRAMPAPDGDAAASDTWRHFAAKRRRGEFAPLAAIEAIEASCSASFDAGLKHERGLFVDLMSAGQSAAMRHLFFAERQAGKLFLPEDTPILDIQSVGIVGAGTMGVGIAAAFLAAGYAVKLFDVNEEALNVGRDRVCGIVEGDLAKARIDPSVRDDRLARFSTTESWEGFKDCNLVVEAVFEDMEIKKDVFSKLASAVRPDCILASNTSYLNVDVLAASVDHPERVLGLHFFSPAHIMKLLEIVRGKQTSPAVLKAALALGKRMKKIGVVCGVCHGFIGNRMLSGYAREAGLLLLEGASPLGVDQALTKFGMPMGPFAMADMAGLDIGYANRKRLSPDQYEERAFRVHDQLVEMGRKGQKTGAGFYRYVPGSRAPLEDPAADEVIDAVRRREGVQPRDIEAAEIVERCIFALINEGSALLGEGIAQRGSDIDVVYANGYGFPRWRGGPFFYADTIGLEHVIRRIESFANHAGSRWWRPAPLLAELAASGGNLARFQPDNAGDAP